MTKEEMSFFYDTISKMTDEEIKETLKNLNRIKEKDLDIGVRLLRLISTSEGRFKLVEKLSDDDCLPNGCIGAIDVAIFLTQPSTIAELTYVVANNIKGRDLYCLWNDCAHRNFNKFIINIWALQSGVYTDLEIKENFRIHHLRADNFKDEAWNKLSNRTVIIPYVFDDKVVNPADYIKDFKNVEPYCKEFKEYVKANRVINRFKNFLYQSGLFCEMISTKKDEIKVKMVMPSVVDGYIIELLEQNFNEDEEIFFVNTNQIYDLLIERPIKKHYDMLYRSDLQKALYYLKDARKKFLPNLCVIRNMPLADIPKFYINNNDKRFGELIESASFNDFYKEEGLFKLAYILGLFSESGNDSERAFDYIKSNVLGVVPSQDLHKLYGAINLNNGFKKDFADFFMIHHSQNINCFMDSEGVDKTNQIYINFEDILEFRSEKSIKTTTNRERLTPDDAISALGDYCFKYGYSEEYRPVLNVIAKYMPQKDGIDWALQALDEAKKLDEREITIPYIEDDLDSSCKFEVLKKGDERVIISGLKSNCCFMWGGAAFRSLNHAVISPNSTVVEFTTKNSYTQGWVWYDKNNAQLVIDNLEGSPERDKDNKEYASNLMNAVLRYADNSLIELNRRGLPCESVRIGTGWLNNLIKNTIQKYEKEGLVEKPSNINIDYILEHNLYSDAKHEQYVLSSTELIKKHKNILKNISTYENYN